MTATTHRPCPRCGSTDAIRIMYGDLGGPTLHAYLRGEIESGGCFVLSKERPDYRCRACRANLPWVADPEEDPLAGTSGLSAWGPMP
jgi:Zn finger protein HypA/HybF involved in hydrogenase expression